MTQESPAEDMVPLFARQPIFDADLRIVGYELLYRGLIGGNTAAFSDGSGASARVLINALTEVDLLDIVAGKRAFVNFTLDMLSAAPDFAKKHLVIELLEDIPITPHLLDKLQELKARGFTIAVDDYGPRKYPADLLNLIDIVKVDLIHLPLAELPRVIDELEPYNVQLLAEKVETLEQYEQCRELGFEMYQGYFFSKPQIVSGRALGTDRAVVLDLISTLYQPEVDIKDVVRVLERDPSLSIKLLRLVNSALYRRQRNIKSLQQAIALLGLNRLRSWITLLLMDNHSDRGKALQDVTLFNAHFCQYLAQETRPPMENAAFTVGLLSCLDAFFDRPMKELLDHLPLDALLNTALLESRGRLGAWLRLARFLERNPVDKVSDRALQQLDITRDQLRHLQQQALLEAREVQRALGAA
ncbi:MAG: HDOD domain-containing protein [Natronospirillum sp.]|uniref:EAL and HDOD domain-containing protein n=1 Tax=Natronospirillum sp. TaxID=2812955 RepID=UPI0025DDC46A|nr:HDOD domain-containing protein [Natronospirillum sp.]MCH8551132.1 HDOD domain-containing protein [Natronospirillum sp.]